MKPWNTSPQIQRQNRTFQLSHRRTSESGLDNNNINMPISVHKLGVVRAGQQAISGPSSDMSPVVSNARTSARNARCLIGALDKLMEQDHRDIKSRTNLIFDFKQFRNAAVTIFVLSIESTYCILQGSDRFHRPDKRTVSRVQIMGTNPCPAEDAVSIVCVMLRIVRNKRAVTMAQKHTQAYRAFDIKAEIDTSDGHAQVTQLTIGIKVRVSGSRLESRHSECEGGAFVRTRAMRWKTRTLRQQRRWAHVAHGKGKRSGAKWSPPGKRVASALGDFAENRVSR
jgi:hypothetical protein